MQSNDKNRDVAGLPELLTLDEAAKYLKCHPNTLRQWDRKGILPAIRIGERKVRRYKKEDLEKFIHSQS